MAYVFIYQHFLLVEATQLPQLSPPHHPDCGTQFPSQPCCAPELFLWLSPLPYIRTLRKAIESQSEIKRVLILHSDQGSQYTSKDFTEYCKRMSVAQSMSKAGYPYDNAPMERYFNTLKNELIYQHEYQTEEALYTVTEEFAYTTCNHRRPHSIKPPLKHEKQHDAIWKRGIVIIGFF